MARAYAGFMSHRFQIFLSYLYSIVFFSRDFRGDFRCRARRRVRSQRLLLDKWAWNRELSRQRDHSIKPLSFCTPVHVSKLKKITPRLNGGRFKKSGEPKRMSKFTRSFIDIRVIWVMSLLWYQIIFITRSSGV